MLICKKYNTPLEPIKEGIKGNQTYIFVVRVRSITVGQYKLYYLRYLHTTCVISCNTVAPTTNYEQREEGAGLRYPLFQIAASSFFIF